MTRDAQLQYCKVCQLQAFDPAHGIICSLTGRPADFEEYCPSFKAKEGADPIIDHYEGKVRFDPDVASASGTKRFINMIIDYIVFYIMAILMGALSGIVVAILFPDQLNELDSLGTPLWSYVIGISLYIAYYTILESSTGRTLGKLVTGTKVVNKEGKLPDTSTIFRRSLTRIVPFEAFSFLSNHRGWHDKWTDTWVIDANKSK